MFGWEAIFFLMHYFSVLKWRTKNLKDAEQQLVSSDPLLINVVIYADKRDNCKSPIIII